MHYFIFCIFFQHLCYLTRAETNETVSGSKYFLDSFFDTQIRSNNINTMNVSKTSGDNGTNALNINNQLSETHFDPDQFISHYPSLADNITQLPDEKMLRLLSFMDILKYLHHTRRHRNKNITFSNAHSQKNLPSRQTLISSNTTNQHPNTLLKYQNMLSSYFGVKMKSNQTNYNGLIESVEVETTSVKSLISISCNDSSKELDNHRLKACNLTTSFQPHFPKIIPTNNEDMDTKPLVH